LPIAGKNQSLLRRYHSETERTAEI
jgi:hypothetical protein